MLAKCFSSFRYLNDGKLFRRDNEEVPTGISKSAPEYFWLCNTCSKVLTLKLDEHGEVLPIAIRATIHGIQSAMDVFTQGRKCRISLWRVGMWANSDRLGKRNRDIKKSSEAAREAYAA